MSENPQSHVIDRETSKDAVDTHLQTQMALLRDLSDYGSNLVLRAFFSSKTDMASIVVCCVFLKQIVAMVDAVEVLLREGCGLAAVLPARAAFEASLYLHYVLEADSDLRASRYYVANVRNDQNWAKKLIPGTPEAKALNELAKELGVEEFDDADEKFAAASKQFEDTQENLAQPGLKEIDDEFTAARKKRPYDVEWYTLGGGISSVRKLAIHLGRLPEYETFYSRGSKVMHTAAYRDHVKFSDGQVHILNVRDISDVHSTMSMICTVAFGAYRRVIGTYRVGEQDALRQKYLDDWKPAFQSIPQFNYVLGPAINGKC